MGGAVDRLDSCITLQRPQQAEGMNREECSQRSICKALHLRRNNPRHRNIRAGDKAAGKQLGRGCGDLAANRLAMNQQRARAAMTQSCRCIPPVLYWE